MVRVRACGGLDGKQLVDDLHDDGEAEGEAEEDDEGVHVPPLLWCMSAVAICPAHLVGLSRSPVVTGFRANVFPCRAAGRPRPGARRAARRQGRDGRADPRHLQPTSTPCAGGCSATPPTPPTRRRRSTSGWSARSSGFRGEAAFGTWLHRVTVNVCMTRCAVAATCAPAARAPGSSTPPSTTWPRRTPRPRTGSSRRRPCPPYREGVGGAAGGRARGRRPARRAGPVDQGDGRAAGRDRRSGEGPAAPGARDAEGAGGMSERVCQEVQAQLPAYVDRTLPRLRRQPGGAAPASVLDLPGGVLRPARPQRRPGVAGRLRRGAA